MKPGIGVVLEVDWFPKTLLIVADEETAKTFGAPTNRGRIFTVAEIATLSELRMLSGAHWREDVRAIALEKIERNGAIGEAQAEPMKGASK